MKNIRENKNIVDIDIRTWLLNFHLHKINSVDCSQESWFLKGRNDYLNLDWKMEIDRFHLNSEQLNSELLDAVVAI